MAGIDRKEHNVLFLSHKVSTKIISLDEEAKQLRVRAADLEDEIEKLSTSNNELIVQKDSLEVDLQEKLILLEQFEVRFEAQFKYSSSYKSYNQRLHPAPPRTHNK